MHDLTQRRNIIILIAIHDLNQALRYCHYAVAIDNGRMLSFGACSEIINAKLLHDVYRVDGHIEHNSLGHRHPVLR